MWGVRGWRGGQGGLGGRGLAWREKLNAASPPHPPSPQGKWLYGQEVGEVGVGEGMVIRMEGIREGVRAGGRGLERGRGQSDLVG